VVECQLPKLDVTGSSPVSRSIKSIGYVYPSFREDYVRTVYFWHSANPLKQKVFSPSP
jgi:hypothetical protein